ncbi:MAG TPA: sugar ABC transporter permease [Planctomycetota bacterium]|nr:sugar ABC transporter permease [Planctomycetota bacterium]
MTPTERDKLRPFLYLLPAALLLGVFSILPLIYGFVVSLCRWGIDYERFVGLGNYYRAAHDPEFRQSLLVTIYYVIGTVPAGLILSYIIASLLFQKLRARGMYRTIYFLPYVTSTVAAAAVWRWFFNPGQRGLANSFLASFGKPAMDWVEESHSIFHSFGSLAGINLDWAGPSLALFCVMIFSIWQSLGFNVVIFLAGLSAVPNEVHEASMIDGAGGWRKAWHVTIPLISPTILFLTVVSIIRAFQAFNQIYVMISDVSMSEARNVTMFIFSKFYVSGEIGYGSAGAFILFIIIMLLTVLQMKYLARRVHY